jgi:PAS domain S-box-containing protein
MSTKLSFKKLKSWFDFNPEMLDLLIGTKHDGLCIWIEDDSEPVYYSSETFNFSVDFQSESTTHSFHDEQGNRLIWDLAFIDKIFDSEKYDSLNYHLKTEDKSFTYKIETKIFVNSDKKKCIIFTAKLSHNADYISLKNPKLFYELFDSSEELIGISNLMGRFTAINKKWIDKTGYTKEELKNIYLLRLIHEDDRTVTNNEFKKLYRKQSRVVNCQSRILHKDGSVIWLEWNAVYDKELASIYVVARDITSKKLLHLFREKSNNLLIKLSSESSLRNYTYNEFLSKLLIESINILNVDKLSIWSYSKENDELNCKYEINNSTKNIQYNTVSINKSTVPKYFKNIEEHKTLSAPDAQNDERTNEFNDGYFLPNNIKSLLDVQINGEFGLVGILCAEHCKTIRYWTDEEENFMYGLSEIISRAISNNQLLQSQTKLKDTLSQLNLTIEAANLGVWELDYTGLYSCNDHMKEIFELPLDTEVSRAEVLSQYVLPDDLALVQKLFSLEANNDKINNYRYRILTPTKKLKYLLGFAKRVNNDKGEFSKWTGVAIDITELTQSQIALKENEERLKFTLDSINDLIMILDANGIFIEFYVPNTIPKWVFKDPYSFIGRHFSELKSDSFKLHLEHLYSDYEEFSDYKQFDYQLEKNSYTMWFGANASIRYNSDGSFAGITVVSRDVSVRKAIEAALNDEKNRVLSIIEGTNVGTWQWNIKTGETEFNERWAEISGYSLEELGPTTIETWGELCHPDDLKRSSRLLEEHFAGKTEYYHIELRMRHKNGQWVWVLDRGKVSEWDENGKPLLMYGTHQDITIRKYTELAMLKLSNELATLNGIELLNETCKYLADTLHFDFAFVGKVDPNKSFVETLNMYSNGIFTDPITYDLKDTPCNNVVNNEFCVYENHVDKLFPKDELLVKMGIKSYAGVPLLDKDGMTKGIIVLLSKKPLKNRNLVDSILSVYRSKVAAELDRIEAEEKLEILIDTTKRQNDRLRHFSFITSHNIRSSVSNILGLTDILGESPEMANNMIPLLSVATKNLDTSIKNANQLLQLEEKLDSSELSECNLSSFVSNILAQLKNRIEEKSIIIDVEIDQNLNLFTNPAYLESVIYNLVSNACKYGINESSKRIVIKCYHAHEGTYIEVRDFGNGLENERDVERIFELGTRLHNSEDGQGFGLFMTKHQVEIMGGTIKVISKKGEGTLFKVHISH